MNIPPNPDPAGNSPEEEVKVSLTLLNRLNWETVIDLEVDNDQKEFVPDNLYSIAQSKFENCSPFGILFGTRMVGFIMYCNFSQICWINRVMVDRYHQRQGIGTQAISLLIQKLKPNPACREIRTSIKRENAIAEYVFMQAGFKRMGEVDGEVIMRYSGI